MKKFNVLRKKYPRFVYESFGWKVIKKNLEISFSFKIEPNIQFNPKIIIKNVDKNQIKKVGVKSPRVVDNLVFNLGLIELLSYWKATCSPEILVKAGFLNDEQIKWWKDLIDRGMGQFFFENRINFQKPNFLKIKTVYVLNGRLKRGTKAEGEINNVDGNEDKILVPIGGGKDSIVTLEILKNTKKELSSFCLNPTEAAKKIMKTAGYKNPIIIQRKIDEKLLELNRRGFLNGHTPFSAYLAFLSVLCAVLFNFKFIAFSNERSSNEGNVKYLGKIINHQYSKTFEFEKKFRDYSKKYLTPEVDYFSFLRPLYDIQIAKLFSKYPKYFPAFLSCNEAYRTDSGTKKPTRKWCGECPKCLFIFASLYPFVEERRLIKIFSQNLFKKKELLSIMLELTGQRKFKPFECVGTKKESLVAFYLSLKKTLEKGEAKIPFLLKYFENKILSKYKNLERESKKLLNAWSNQHNLPKNFEKILKGTISS